MALIARGLSGGFHAAWPLALGVVIGDALWPLLAIIGVTWIVEQFDGFMTVLRWGASLIFLVMGILLIRNAGKTIAKDSRLTRPGMWAGFVAGVLVILGNPKAILFYMGVLPGFFDLTTITWPDVAAIVALSICRTTFRQRHHGAVHRPRPPVADLARRVGRLNIIAGWLLIAVGLVIPSHLTLNIVPNP